MKNKMTGLGLVVVFVVSFGATALATHDGPNANSSLSDSTTGASFSGSREWYPRSDHQGGWHHWGTLTDTGCDDGDNVYTKARPEGYAYTSYYGDKACDGVGDNKAFIDEVEADPQQLYTDDADWAVCRDKNFPLSDNCSSIRHFSR